MKIQRYGQWVLIYLSQVLGVVAYSCTSSPKTMDMPDSNYEVLMAERFGEEGECHPNDDGSFMLCNSGFLVMDQTPGIQFFIYSINEAQITYESDANCSAVHWADDYYVEVLQSAGMVKKNAESSSKRGFLVDVRTGERQSLR